MFKSLAWFAVIFCPGIVFLMTGQYMKMMFAFFLQATFVGWIPATIWAGREWIGSNG